MKKLRKHKDEGYSILVDRIVASKNDRNLFFYNMKNDGRFFAPTYKIFDSTNPNDSKSEFSERLLFALLYVIENDSTIAGYIDTDGCYVVHVGQTHKSCITAVKEAKINLEPTVIDLITEKLFSTNG